MLAHPRGLLRSRCLQGSVCFHDIGASAHGAGWFLVFVFSALSGLSLPAAPFPKSLAGLVSQTMAENHGDLPSLAHSPSDLGRQPPPVFSLSFLIGSLTLLITF